jgi:hypothetical protein
VTSSAPRIAPPLIEAIPRLDDGTRPIAEVCRLLGTEADRRGLTRPSYEAVRAIVHLFREVDPDRERGPSVASLLLDFQLRNISAYRLLDELILPRDERRR